MSSTLSVTRTNRLRVLRVIKGDRASGLKDESGGHVGLHRAHLAIARIDAGQGYVAGLEAQIAALKEVAALLRAELSDVRAQRDEWRAGGIESRLTVMRTVASRSQPWWRRP
jgi:hypothetical protein